MDEKERTEITNIWAIQKRDSQVLCSSIPSPTAASTSMNCSTSRLTTRGVVEAGGEGILAKMAAISSA